MGIQPQKVEETILTASDLEAEGLVSLLKVHRAISVWVETVELLTQIGAWMWDFHAGKLHAISDGLVMEALGMDWGVVWTCSQKGVACFSKQFPVSYL